PSGKAKAPPTAILRATPPRVPFRRATTQQVRQPEETFSASLGAGGDRSPPAARGARRRVALHGGPRHGPVGRCRVHRKGRRRGAAPRARRASERTPGRALAHRGRGDARPPALWADGTPP